MSCGKRTRPGFPEAKNNGWYIAAILALQPDILILDEAFVMLDPKSRKELLATLKS